MCICTQQTCTKGTFLSVTTTSAAASRLQVPCMNGSAAFRQLPDLSTCGSHHIVACHPSSSKSPLHRLSTTWQAAVSWLWCGSMQSATAYLMPTLLHSRKCLRRLEHSRQAGLLGPSFSHAWTLWGRATWVQLWICSASSSRHMARQIEAMEIKFCWCACFAWLCRACLGQEPDVCCCCCCCISTHSLSFAGAAACYHGCSACCNSSRKPTSSDKVSTASHCVQSNN